MIKIDHDKKNSKNRKNPGLKSTFKGKVKIYNDIIDTYKLSYQKKKKISY